MTRRILATLFALVVAVGLAAPAPAPAFASTGVTIHGVVTMPDGSVPDAQPQIVPICGAFGGSCAAYTSTYNAATGAYTVDLASGGNYIFGFTYAGATSNVVSGVYWAGGTAQSTSGVTETFTAGQDYAINLAFVKGAVVTGHLTGADAPLPQSGPTINGSFTNGTFSFPGTFDAATQTYRIDSLPAGSFNFTFADPAPFGSATKYQGVTLAITVTAGQVATGPDVTLARTASISGHVFIDNGAGPVPYSQGPVIVQQIPFTGAIVGQATPDATGAYEIDNVPPGTYVICGEGSHTVIESCWNGPDPSSATTVTVTTGQQITGRDFAVTGAGYITAHMMITDTKSPAVNFVTGVADLWKLNDAGTFYDFVSTANTDGNGGIQFEQLLPGTYRIEFRDPDGNYRSEWWDNQHYFGATGEDIVITAGQTLNLGDVVLLPRDFDVTRTFDQDRFSGAVQMTQAIWPLPNDINPQGGVPLAGVPIIYIANGLNYPDALSAGPAAIVQQGALLLVLPTSIPASVQAELTRLRPQQIVIVGGPASVSTDVETQLGNYSSNVSRQTGADRFEASRNLAASVWGGPSGPGAPAVFISTGLNFPDALDAGPAAGLIDAPVILVNGSLPTLDPDTVQLLSDLGTINVFIAGGPGSVSPGIEAQLTDLMGANHLHRFTGDTRYEAAAAINQWFFPTAETVFLATGANFPDALAGAPLAGAIGGPIYLSQPACIPQIVAGQILDGDTQQIWLLGGPASLTPAVEDLTLCSS